MTRTEMAIRIAEVETSLRIKAHTAPRHLAFLCDYSADALRIARDRRTLPEMLNDVAAVTKGLAMVAGDGPEAKAIADLSWALGEISEAA